MGLSGTHIYIGPFILEKLQFYILTQGLLNLDGRNCQKYFHQTKADFLTLIMLHKLTASL